MLSDVEAATVNAIKARYSVTILRDEKQRLQDRIQAINAELVLAKATYSDAVATLKASAAQVDDQTNG